MRVNISLKIRFLFLIFFILLLGGTAFYFAANRQISSFFLNKARDDFANHVNIHAKEYFDLSKLTTLKLSGKYQEYAKRLEAISGTEEVTVLDSNGTIIYAKNEILIGTTLLNDNAVTQALQGKTTLNQTKGQSRALIVAPIIGEDGSVRGVISARVNLGGTDVTISKLRLELAVTICILFTLVLIVSYLIFSGADNEMKAQGRIVIDKSKALEEEQQLDEAILASVAESLIVINRDGQILLFNPEAERITGHKSADVEYRLYKKIIKICDKDGNVSINNPITKGLETGKKISINLKEGLYLKDASDSLIPISVSVAPIAGRNETVRGVVATIQDATAEKELDKVKDEFVYIVVHELGNPVFALDGYLAMLDEHCSKKDTSMRNMIESARETNEQLSSLVNDLLEMIRSESGQLKVEVEPIAIAPIIEKTADAAKIKARTKKITLRVPKEKLPNVLGNEGKIKEVLTNLIDNAIKYTPKNGEVLITTTTDKKFLTIGVQDNGFGISTEAQKQLFNKFYRVKDGKTKGIPGTGLGLFICRQIVEKCGGKIWVESEEGKGSTFYFSLKITK